MRILQTTQRRLFGLVLALFIFHGWITLSVLELFFGSKFIRIIPEILARAIFLAIIRLCEIIIDEFPSSLVNLTVYKTSRPFSKASHPWKAPDVGCDSRGPCPALNTLANHGFLPHSGRSIDHAKLVQALCDGFHLSRPLTHFLSFGAYGVITQLGHLALEDLTSSSCCVHNAFLVHRDRSMSANGDTSSTAPATSSSPAELDEQGVHIENRALLPSIAMLQIMLWEKCWNYYVALLGLGHLHKSKGAKALVLCIFRESLCADAHMLEDLQTNNRFPHGWEPTKMLGILEMVRTARTLGMAMETVRADEGREHEPILSENIAASPSNRTDTNAIREAMSGPLSGTLPSNGNAASTQASSTVAQAETFEERIDRLSRARTMITTADRARSYIILGMQAYEAFLQQGELSYIDKAIASQQQAVVLTPDGHADKPGHLNNLGNSFLCRFERLGDIADVNQAIASQQQAVVLTPDGHADKPVCLNNLGNSFSNRFKRLGDIADVNQAIASQQQAVVLTPDGHASKPRHLSNLGMSLHCRFAHLGTSPDLENASSFYCQSALCHLGPPSTLFWAAICWARCSLTQHGKPLLQAHARVIDLVPRIAWLGTHISNRYEEIVSIRDAVNAAVAAAVVLGKPDLALEWMEQGRSIVWGQILRLRTPMDVLKASSRPDLAYELEHVSQGLEWAGTTKLSNINTLDSDETIASLEDEAQKHRRLAEKYDRLLEEIREIAGFQRFLLPKKMSELRGAARQGPVHCAREKG